MIRKSISNLPDNSDYNKKVIPELNQILLNSILEFLLDQKTWNLEMMSTIEQSMALHIAPHIIFHLMG